MVSGFLVFSVALALAIPAVTRGSYSHLLSLRWRWVSVLAAGLALHWASGHVGVLRDHFSLGFGVLVAAYVLLIGFGLANVVHRGMAVVTIGIVCNFVAIVVNTGMPVAVPPDWQATGGVETTATHHARTSDDKLDFLGDIVVLRLTDEAISFGDLVVLVGLCDLTFQASRRRSRRTAKLRVSRAPASRTRPVVAQPVTLPDVPAYEPEAELPVLVERVARTQELARPRAEGERARVRRVPRHHDDDQLTTTRSSAARTRRS